MKQNRAVVFSLSSDCAFAVACVMMDIKKLFPTWVDEVVIIHDGIGKRDQRLLNSIFPSRFILYDFPIKDTAIFNQETLTHFTKMVFAKFECLKLLDEYKNVLYLDYDIVVQKDISEVFAHCVSGVKMMWGGLNVRGQLHEPIVDFNMETEGICGSIFVFQDHLIDYMKMYDFCYESLARYAKQLYLGEQAIFDFMIQEFNLQICPIDGQIYSAHPNDIKLADKAKIIHAYGQPKFWNGLNNEQWNINYQIWIAMGGSRYGRSTLKNVFQKAMSILRAVSKKPKLKGI